MNAWLCLGTALLLVPVLAHAQPARPADAAAQTAAPPITLAYADGAVDMARDTGVSRAEAPDLLDDGDRLITTDGRAQLVFGDGAVAYVDRDTDLRVDSDARLRLVRGHLLVRTSSTGDLHVATPAGLARLAADGEYDLTASDLDGDTIVGAIRGHMALRTSSGELPIAAPEVLTIDPRNPQPWRARGHGLRTPLGAWADDRERDAAAALRGQPLPAALAPYAPAFANHGQWTSIAPHGQVWMPIVVAGWRPYMHGAWRSTRYGWTWIDSEPWAWPMHHYGRWGRQPSGQWFWIPQASWGPAWVSWAIGSDHVGWSPLGWDSRPVVDFFAGVRGGSADRWASTWSLVPWQAFGQGAIVQHLQDPRYLPGPVLGGFVVQAQPPAGGSPRDGTVRWTDHGRTPRPGPGQAPGTGLRPPPVTPPAPTPGAAPLPVTRYGMPVYRVRRPDPPPNQTPSTAPPATAPPAGGSGGAVPRGSVRRGEPGPPPPAAPPPARGPRGDGAQGATPSGPAPPHGDAGARGAGGAGGHVGPQDGSAGARRRPR